MTLQSLRRVVVVVVVVVVPSVVRRMKMKSPAKVKMNLSLFSSSMTSSVLDLFGRPEADGLISLFVLTKSRPDPETLRSILPVEPLATMQSCPPGTLYRP